MVRGKKCAKCEKDMPWFPWFKGWRQIEVKGKNLLYCPECYQLAKNEQTKMSLEEVRAHTESETVYEKGMMVSLKKALILEKNEKILDFWEGDHEARMTVTEDTWLGKKPKTVKQTKKGILVLTNRKLVWIEQRGIFGKSYHPLITIPLENLRGITMEGAIFKYVSISDAQGEHIFHFPFSITNENQLSDFKEIVFNQVNARKQELEAEKRRERVHVLVDFSFLKNYMKKGGLVMQTIKCPECKASIKLPESGNLMDCEYCGNTIYAQDIFEKIKELIG